MKTQLGGGGAAARCASRPTENISTAWARTITIYDTSDFKVVDTIELSKPQFPGMQNVNLGQQLDSIQEPGVLVSLFNSSDPGGAQAASSASRASTWPSALSSSRRSVRRPPRCRVCMSRPIIRPATP